MAEEKKSAADEAKGFSADVVNSLGLIEIILGVVGLYGLWLCLKTTNKFGNIFPTTGNTFVDVGLQLFAAALAGKIICLLVAVPMALGRFIIRKSNTEKYYKALREAVSLFYDAEKLTGIEEKHNLIDIGVNHLSQADASLKILFDRHRTKIIVAYGTTLLIVIYLIYLLRLEEVPKILSDLLIAGALIFALLGLVEQFSLVKEIAQSLIALKAQKKEEKAASSENEVKNLVITVKKVT